MSDAPDDTSDASDPRVDVAGVLHDVSNALTVMLGWVVEARGEEATRETIAYALGVVERRARMARDLARRSIGATNLDPIGDDLLEAVVADAVEALTVEAERASVRIVQGRGAGGVRIGGAADVSHGLTNVLLNALAHAPAGSRIVIDLDAQAGFCFIDVQDEGEGVAPERHETIFTGDSARVGGAGVGLRHARAVARRAGGDLALVDSDRGARFRLTWPRMEAVVPPPPPSMLRVRALEGKRILVVEDDGDVIDLLDTALEARGALVQIARSASELAAVLTGPPIHSALLDLSPIADDVAGALAAVRAHSPKARVVLITGSATGLPAGIPADSVGWVRKPFEVGEVVDALLAPSPSPTK